jgi:hypothetical protein
VLGADPEQAVHADHQHSGTATARMIRSRRPSGSSQETVTARTKSVPPPLSPTACRRRARLVAGAGATAGGDRRRALLAGISVTSIVASALLVR